MATESLHQAKLETIRKLFITSSLRNMRETGSEGGSEVSINIVINWQTNIPANNASAKLYDPLRNVISMCKQ